MITDAALGTGLQKSCKRGLPLAPDDPSRGRTTGATNRVIPRRHTCCCDFGIESFFGSGLIISFHQHQYLSNQVISTTGFEPRGRPKGRATASPLWKPHRSFDFAQDGELVEPLCARGKPRGILIIKRESLS